MKIPHTHYAYFWVVNTLMAIGTGFVLWLMTIRFLSMARITAPVAILVPILIFLWQQITLISFFAGRRRGAFEYSYLEKITEHSYGNPELRDQLQEAKQEFKLGDPKSGNAKLKSVADKYPDDFVVNFKYATSCEKVGLGKEAIEAYRKALALLKNSSSTLCLYVESQIARVEKDGPSKKSSAPGLQYVVY